MTSKQTLLTSFFAILILLWCVCCSPTQKKLSVNTLKIEAKPNVITLYYSDVINPIEILAINNTEADGIVDKKFFEYGSNVKKGQLLFLIHSDQLAKNYNDALNRYVKAVDSLETAQYAMDGADYLKKLQIMSQQEYNSVKSQLFNAKLEFDDASTNLYLILQQGGIDIAMLNKVKTKNPQVIYNALANKPKKNVFEVYAPEAGLALLPTEEGKDTASDPVQEGDRVKSGQELLNIGNLSGISITLKISENNIDKIKVGQKAIVTGDAFPDVSLDGVVVSVGRQAVGSSGSSSTPNFAVKVNVPSVPKEALNKIRIGMTADVAFPLESPPVIKIPLTAIIKKDDQTFVKKVDPKSQKISEVPVVVGRTDVDSIEIIEGLKNKDEVVINATSD